LFESVLRLEATIINGTAVAVEQYQNETTNDSHSENPFTRKLFTIKHLSKERKLRKISVILRTPWSNFRFKDLQCYNSELNGW
jgi:hypothetical protein